MDIDDALSELEAVGIGTTTTTTSDTISIDPCYPNSTTGVGIGQIFVGDSTNYVVFGGGGDNPWTTIDTNPQTTLQMGPMTFSPLENGDVEIIMDVDGVREEYQINAEKVRGFLRSIADIIVEGRET
jgi:hypothetical protein